jgi:hypothetical protein
MYPVERGSSQLAFPRTNRERRGQTRALKPGNSLQDGLFERLRTQ